LPSSPQAGRVGGELEECVGEGQRHHFFD
jgi:hypothetical protein